MQTEYINTLGRQTSLGFRGQQEGLSKAHNQENKPILSFVHLSLAEELSDGHCAKWTSKVEQGQRQKSHFIRRGFQQWE